MALMASWPSWPRPGPTPQIVPVSRELGIFRVFRVPWDLCRWALAPVRPCPAPCTRRSHHTTRCRPCIHVYFDRGAKRLARALPRSGREVSINLGYQCYSDEFGHIWPRLSHIWPRLSHTWPCLAVFGLDISLLGLKHARILLKQASISLTQASLS